MKNEDLVFRLRKRAEIRLGIPTRKSVQAGEPDRLAALLTEAADEIEALRGDASLDKEQRELAVEACVEAGHNCDRAVGRGPSKSGDAFRAVASKLRGK